MRLILLPNAIEDQCAKNLAWDQVATDSLPLGCSPVRVAICQDGRGHFRRDCCASDLPEAGYFEKLYTRCQSAVDLQFESFSFFDDFTKQHTVISNSDILYFCGFGGTMPECLQSVFRNDNHKEVINLIRWKVRCDDLLYIGVCGGAMIAGCKYGCSCSVEYFNFLEGSPSISEVYDSCVSPEAVSFKTSNEIVQMTSGCGLALSTKHGLLKASSFPVIKNKAQWWLFAKENTLSALVFSSAFF